MSYSAVACAYICTGVCTDCTRCRRYAFILAHPLGYVVSQIRFKVPGGVLSVLPGPGATTGKELVSHPLIRKVDITVTYIVFVIWHASKRISRQVLKQGAPWEASSVGTWRPLPLSSVARQAGEELRPCPAD
jgi:hypothetical protein